jgi:hypothetical protein
MSGRTGLRSSAGDNDDDEGGAGRRSNRGPRFSLTLDGKDSYKSWATGLNSYTYGKGKKYHSMYKQGMKASGADDPDSGDEGDDNEEYHSEVRRTMWTIITGSLSKADMKKVKSIPIGHVEQLLRALKGLYNAQSQTDLDHCRHLNETIKLTDYQDLNTYFAACEDLQMRFDAV